MSIQNVQKEKSKEMLDMQDVGYARYTDAGQGVEEAEWLNTKCCLCSLSNVNEQKSEESYFYVTVSIV